MYAIYIYIYIYILYILQLALYTYNMCMYVCIYYIYVAVEVRKRTLYRKLILRKWRLKFSNDFDVILVVILDNLLYACKTFNGHSVRLCFMFQARCRRHRR